jgi:hypothetical protein
MTEAVIVNPFSREELSEALKLALSMDRAERIRRWSLLMEGLRTSDVKIWRDSFVDALKGAHEPRRSLIRAAPARTGVPGGDDPQDEPNRPLGTPTAPRGTSASPLSEAAKARQHSAPGP